MRICTPSPHMNVQCIAYACNMKRVLQEAWMLSWGFPLHHDLLHHEGDRNEMDTSIAKVGTNADKLPHFFAVYPARVGRRAILLGHFARSAGAGSASVLLLSPPDVAVAFNGCRRRVTILSGATANMRAPFLPSFQRRAASLPSPPLAPSPVRRSLPPMAASPSS